MLNLNNISNFASAKHISSILKQMRLSQKAILIMPALFDHVDLIKEAKNNGFTVITCDNNPNNIGHKYADEQVNIDLLDLKSLLEYAKMREIDAVMTFSTDIGAIPAAYIADKLNLVGGSLNATEIMANKNKFRNFLKDNNFNIPLFQTIKSLNELDLSILKFPIIIKPTDRAGSKGVYIVRDIGELIDKFDYTKNISFEKKVIVEEYIETEYKQIHGDAIVQNGEIVFFCLGDQFFGEGNKSFSPIATVFPTSSLEITTNKIYNELQRFIELVGYKNGGINIECRIDIKGNLFFIELAPRYGGNYIPKTISYACNLNILKYAFNVAVGCKINIPDFSINNQIFQLILRSHKQGVFNSFSIIKNQFLTIIENHAVKKRGDIINFNVSTGDIISIFILKAENDQIKHDVIYNPDKYFTIHLT